MRKWNITSQALPYISIATDTRLSNPNYVNDHIWDLTLRGGEPPALALETTYGLRAKGIRLFPRFEENGQNVIDPEQYSQQPVLKEFYPNYLNIKFSPFTDIDVEAAFWVPHSNVVAGRLRIVNQSNQPRQIQFEWIGLLTPIDEGERMAPVEIQATTVLLGQTGNLYPVVFLTGGPSPAIGPYPGLAHSLDLASNEECDINWTQAALDSPQASFEIARKTASRNWEAEHAKIEMVNADQVEVVTGENDWDIAFALSQKIALSLFIGPTDNLPCPSFVYSRLPDQGYSLRGDGSDYGDRWNGQDPLNAYYLMNIILPGASNLLQGVLNNFFSSQREGGYIDLKPGLGGQRSGKPATPILGTMALNYFQYTGDKSYLKEIFPNLLSFFQFWFNQENDRDNDGIPEWDHPKQFNFDDHPMFARWHSWAKGIDISTVETPSLSSFLYQEALALIEISKLIDQTEWIDALEKIAENLRIAVETSWDETNINYCYRDRDTHFTTAYSLVGQHGGNGELEVHRIFEWPARLLIRINASGESTRRPNIFIHGVSASGSHKVERISLDRFLWYLGWATATSEYTYASIERIEIQGLEENDFITIQTVNLDGQDQTLFTPLWAKIPSQDRAYLIVSRSLSSPTLFWRPHGIASCLDQQLIEQGKICDRVDLSWNLLVGEGLLNYGFRPQAAELMNHIMKAITESLRKEGSMFRYYHADSGKGIGDRDSLAGLAPLGFFLKILGVKLISPYKVEITGNNPFSMPVTVKYRGLTILRQKDKTQVIFPDGQLTELISSSPQIISLE